MRLGLAVGRDGPPLDAQQLRRVGEHLHEVLEPELAEQLLAARLDREDAGAHHRRYLSIVDDHDGGVRLRGVLTIEAGAILRAVLDPLAAPRPAAPGKDEQGDSPPGDTASGGTAFETDGLVTDNRTGGQRLADALVEVADRALAQGELPASGGQRPTLVLTMNHGQLAAGLGAGTLPDGNQLSPSAVARIACDAAIITAILGTRGQVLYLGRAARTASPAQRRALALRDRGCGLLHVKRRAVIDRPPGVTPITSSTGTASAAPIWTICFCSADTTIGSCITTGGRSGHRPTGSDRCSFRRRGSTRSAAAAETFSTTPVRSCIGSATALLRARGQPRDDRRARGRAGRWPAPRGPSPLWGPTSG